MSFDYARWKRGLRERRREEKVCLDCGGELDRIGARCMSCCDANSARRWLIEQAREKEGLCKTCGKVRVERRKICRACIAKSDARKKKAKACPAGGRVAA